MIDITKVNEAHNLFLCVIFLNYLPKPINNPVAKTAVIFPIEYNTANAGTFFSFEEKNKIKNDIKISISPKSIKTANEIILYLKVRPLIQPGFFLA